MGSARSDVLGHARGLSSEGNRDEALRVLHAHLTNNPNDTDARVLYGTILSWEGAHDLARQQLEAVLERHPGHGDALRALVNVELWSNHPARAEQLAAEALREKPGDAAYLLSRAKALQAMRRDREALDEVRRVLVVEPGNEQALRMRRSLRDGLRFWQVGMGFTYDTFDDGRASWQEGDISLKRQTRLGAIIAHAYRGRRFGIDDQMVEVEAYPRFRPGTHAYVSFGYAPQWELYPEYRYAFDLWHTLGAGFEASGGFRRLHFSSDVNIYVAALGKYQGNWYVGGRTYLTPTEDGTSASLHVWVRKFVGDGDAYVGARYGRGASREEIRNQNDVALLDSDTMAGELNLPLSSQVSFTLRASATREARALRDDLRQYSVETRLFYRF